MSLLISEQDNPPRHVERSIYLPSDSRFCQVDSTGHCTTWTYFVFWSLSSSYPWFHCTANYRKFIQVMLNPTYFSWGNLIRRSRITWVYGHDHRSQSVRGSRLCTRWSWPRTKKPATKVNPVSRYLHTESPDPRLLFFSSPPLIYLSTLWFLRIWILTCSQRVTDGFAQPISRAQNCPCWASCSCVAEKLVACYWPMSTVIHSDFPLRSLWGYRCFHTSHLLLGSAQQNDVIKFL